VIIKMASRQVGGLSSYPYVGHILKTAHCFYTKIDTLKANDTVIKRKGKKSKLLRIQ